VNCPTVTAGDVLFIGATVYDKKFRAFDSLTGKLLWETVLPNAAIATPATYMIDGKQYVVVAAGGEKIPKRLPGVCMFRSPCRRRARLLKPEYSVRSQPRQFVSGVSQVPCGGCRIVPVEHFPVRSCRSYKIRCLRGGIQSTPDEQVLGWRQ
jgi:hypothetical protein